MAAFASQPPRPEPPETNKTSNEPDPVTPIQAFFKKLTLGSLTYDSKLSYADDLASPKLPLKPRPFVQGERKLTFIFKLGYLLEEINFFFSKSSPIKENEEEMLKLKLSITYDPSEMSKAFGFNPYHIHDRRDLLFALEHGPIRSAERLATSLNKDVSELHFTMLRRNSLLQVDGIDPMFYTYFNPLTSERNYVRCIIVPLAPWEFTSEDFDKFTKLGMFTDGNDNAELMWSYLHDLCSLNECDYFILTTYENWAFGRFSHTYVEGFISEPIPRTSENLVMKYFTYWILNSCYTTDTAFIQETDRHELEYGLIKSKEKFCRPLTSLFDFLETLNLLKVFGLKRERYHFALASRERPMGRPVSPDPFSDSESDEDEDLPKPLSEWNMWYESPPPSPPAEIPWEIKRDIEKLGEEIVVDDDMEGRDFVIEPMKDLDISASEEVGGVPMDVEVVQDAVPDQIPQEYSSPTEPPDLCPVDSDLPSS